MGNAVKFTHRGEIVVRVDVVESESEYAVIRVEVSDTGVGMTAEAQERVFQAFVQADSSTTRKYGGTGLGLVICERLVEAMAGEIGVRSQLGEGSTFWFTVRVGRHDAPLGVTAWPTAEFANRRILIVEDHPASGQVLQAILCGWGMVADVVDSGAEAIDLLLRAKDDGSPYEVVMVDGTLPKIDGTAVGQKISAEPSLGDLPQVLMAPIGTRANSMTAAEAGRATRLAKPIRRDRLWRCLVTALGIKTKRTEKRARASREIAVVDETGVPLASVLLAEDNPVNQKVMVRTLEKLGYSVDIANDGSEAVRAAGSNRYDIVLMDCEMPTMDGYQATRAIRASEANGKRTPIVALTANVMNGNREKCLEAGMDDHVIKPVKRQVLVEVLEKWIEADGSLSDDR
jgi:CheY-like chemotaxis protein